ncbi:putative microtubule-associated protein [Helianthus annuus]|uniref:Microtubule-associated protein n=1 Tax=Helianthus annuus TaxID=4232 RepID=A0A251SNU7_HELAN|nr:microtubule-associated protein 70-2 [Helianthus annuus]KAF5771714.1 putative microtubule-associated protein [Helianthus annuus]KAJ0496252.1 putative microtubule-associated protein [Helianthus annuus]
MTTAQVSNGGISDSSPLKKSPSFRYGRKKSVTRTAAEIDDIINHMHGSDPVRFELNRLENQLRDKDRELGDAYTEIKALKYQEHLKDKAVEELNDELNKVDEKLKTTESLLESKNLEIKKLNDEKKQALSAQYAAEATLRRVHAAQKDDEMPLIEAIIAPLEAELKSVKMELSKLQDDNKALDRLSKSKEIALLEADRTIEMAMMKASMVDDLQNKNQELMKQIEMCQEENRILDKMNRQKVSEVEKLTQTVCELEEAVLAAGATANAVRDYERKMQEINEEKKILDRELARAKISANRVAVVVANEWKDADSKVMPVKQWLEERRILQGEMQHLKDKLTVAERTAKAEAQLKEKYRLRFKVLEERFKSSSGKNISYATPERTTSNARSQRQSLGGVENLSRSPSCRLSSRKLLKNPSASSKVHDCSKLVDSDKPFPNGDDHADEKDKSKSKSEDFVSGMLYDMLQKEVLNLQKACHQKDQNLKEKENTIETLARNVETLNRAMEVESKKTRREIAAMEKELAAVRVDKGRDGQMGRRTSMSTPRTRVMTSAIRSACSTK